MLLVFPVPIPCRNPFPGLEESFSIWFNQVETASQVAKGSCHFTETLPPYLGRQDVGGAGLHECFAKS
jgi:hypothetical protein